MGLKAKQKVWWYDNAAYEIKPGVLVSAENMSSSDEEPTLSVRTEELYGTTRMLQAWVFDTEEEADKFFKDRIKQLIRRKRKEIEFLESKI